MQNALPYNHDLKNLKFDEITFQPLGIVIRELSDDRLKFKDILLESCSAAIGIKVLKLNLFVTPGQPDFNNLGFLYLEDKTILPVRIKENPDLGHIAKDGEDWLLCYSERECKMDGMAHEWQGKSYNIKDYDVYKETGKYLFENSPLKFNEEEVAAEKAEYLKKFINTNNRPVDPSASFKELIKISGGKVVPPVQDHFHEFKALTGYELPPELKIIYSLSNGATFFPDRICAYQLMSFESVIAQWKQWKKIYDEWTLSALQFCKSDGDKTLPMYTTPYWIPFLTDRTGNYVAIDYAPNKKGKPGQVIVFGADETKIRVLANDLNSFLKLFAAKDDSLGLIDEQPEEED